LVIAHSDTVLLQNATGRVSPSGRARVLHEKRKNVHAGIVGTLVHTETEGYFPRLTEVTYNPYKYETFVDKDTEEPYTGSQYAYMDNKRVFALEVLDKSQKSVYNPQITEQMELTL
jgi:hypothetical protein